ncbi:hypothetical protein AJ85_16620 [Alkalihalobacillus alcalophilus ATCC 27647 = CGMCC 1.3604]|uniref:Glycosyl transferase family 1 n=1 Tax=Alkalihalobacillus alcalophilus ATCC 27647 = CGMCC 1.3604 TaxID=1218173 RepID=A0A094YUX4_ALKAL|nr:glycosyltransferase [Alkalihalobacillus alcalophilus]KGA97302.1 glycosyl transferase family 1 [Alkalihalobacillus alcalophilus ATCC 27647 = CGMCC 1.3604]MED1562521.1 glycosyltransferase [Alkalihalobacillus alcalophilus]THG92140.1 hypothetical protein AJ85_16620 [Alkalihalobacillus alcalophilus ATCC 27647 = CGMCC 1.3604]
MGQKKLVILILVREFWRKFPKHKSLYDLLKPLQYFADVYYWHEDGHIQDILNKFPKQPDFILHYDNANRSALAPIITGLETVSIPKGCVVIDERTDQSLRQRYFIHNKIDLIFSVTKAPFLKSFPQFKAQFRWFPFSINSRVFKDWKLPKNISGLLMGHIDSKYPFRAKVLEEMRGVGGFKYHPHMSPVDKGIFDEQFSKELNRSKIFFTCGSIYEYPVRKFFEALGSRTLLLAEYVPDIEELGFIDGIHYVVCTKDNFKEKYEYYLKHEEERKKIIDQGYQFVQCHHTSIHRAHKMVQDIKAFIQSKNKDNIN